VIHRLSGRRTSSPALINTGILLVDDDPTRLHALEVVLAPMKQHLVRAASGREALRLLLSRDFAVVLLDVRMPGMDGYETAELMRQRPQSEHTPIIFITAYGPSETDVARGYSLGAVDYLFAPLVPEIVRAKVAVFVDLYRKSEAIKQQAAALAAVAATDALTGLCNRGEFERIIAAPQSRPFAILAIDVDKLKPINDTYGHEAGDQALRAIATALRMGMRDCDIVARTGGDEFAAFLLGADADHASVIAERLRHSMYGVSLAHGQPRISVGCAIGQPSDSAPVIWSRADDALYRAKRNGRDRCETYSVESANGFAAQLERWETILSSLLVGKAMSAVYQPVVDLETGVKVGFEALGRPPGQRPDVNVDGLFAAAERLGWGRDLDWICRKAAVQSASGLPDGCTIFVNVGVSALLDPVHDVDQMLLLLRWAKRDPGTVVLEITEREAVQDIHRLIEVLTTYRERGFRFALDDVGAGHSTFEVLAAAVPEFVKVSENLTRRADEPGPQSAIRAVVTFASSSGSHVIAEGLETDTTVNLMRRLGVTLGQGFALGPPAAARHWRDREAPPAVPAVAPRHLV
jgi:diguanylate cyclase